MLLVLVGALIMGCGLTKLMLSNQVAINEQLDGVVKRCARNPVLLVFHAQIQRLNIKMPLNLINLMQNSKTLRSFSMLVQFDVSRKNFFDAVLNALVHRGELRGQKYRGL